MTTTEMLDQTTADQLSTRFNRCFETFTAPDDLFSPDAFFDFFPPYWRFQLQGPEAFVAQIRSIVQGPVEIRVIDTVPTAQGFLTIHEETHHGDKVETARRVWLCTVRDGQIVEAAGYCNGGWDDELKARHAAEAPMIRP